MVIFIHRYLDSDHINFQTFVFLNIIIQHDCLLVKFYWWTSNHPLLLWNRTLRLNKFLNGAFTMLNNVVEDGVIILEAQSLFLVMPLILANHPSWSPFKWFFYFKDMMRMTTRLRWRAPQTTSTESATRCSSWSLASSSFWSRYWLISGRRGTGAWYSANRGRC